MTALEKIRAAKKQRINNNYTIIEGCYVANTEIVIGYNPKAANPYVCWYCKDGIDYFWGYYTNELRDARQKLMERYKMETDASYHDAPVRERDMQESNNEPER